MVISFWKYQGAGNDFVLFDDREFQLSSLSESDIQHLCDRHFGIGADGLMLLRNSAKADFEMVYFNADGRPSSMCGNGGRCITLFAKDLGLITESCNFLAVDGMHQARILENGEISLEMSDVKRIEKLTETSVFLDTGSPHFVQLFEGQVPDNFIEKAKEIRYNHRFQKEGVNVNFVSTESKNVIRTYERGVEDETLACGTGITAAALTLNFLKDAESPIEIEAIGGKVLISFEKASGCYTNIWKTGPAKQVFKGQIEL